MSTTLNLSDLDFDAIKSNLKEFLRNQPEYRDINFESSNIAVLIDLLAYNTYLNAFYGNMIAAEMFMDSAVMRDSVVSHAKELNYVPRSFRSAQAVVNLTIETGNSALQSILIPRGTSFTTQVGSNTFTFSVSNNIVSTSTNGTFTASSVALFEGTYLSDAFVYDVSTADVIGEQQRQRFILSNQQVDVDSLDVNVIEDGGATILPYQRYDQLSEVKEGTRAYFIQAVENNQYEIYFGTGIVGRRPKNGALITAEYRIGSGELCNGADTFAADGAIDGHSNVSVETVSAAEGGAVFETTESIRFNAPRYFQTQGRAVTADDYKTILTVEFPEIDAINVFGGEELDPPQFGKVFVSVNRDNAAFVSDERKTVYKNFLRKRTSLAIEPEFIDPDFLFLVPLITVKYNINATIKNEEDIRSLVAAAVTTFNDEEIDDYQVTMRYSKLIRAIDDADESILSNETDVRLYKLISPDTSEESFTDTLFFHNPLRHELIPHDEPGTAVDLEGQHTIESTIFVSNGRNVRFESDDDGEIHLFEIVAGQHGIVQRNVGTVDFATGRVDLGPVKIDSYAGNGIRIYATTESKDIIAERNSILTIRDSDISITVVTERI